MPGATATVGAGEPRGEKALAGLAVQERVEARKAKLRYAIHPGKVAFLI